jgi:UDP-3-O-[3-hydroxymyristoyl] glucosamine N-acyltransferase
MHKKAFTLEELAAFTNSQLVGDPHHRITGFADLESACSEEASFLSNAKYMKMKYENAMRKSAAGVIFVAPHISLIEGRNFLINENPSRAFQKALEALYNEPQELSGFSGIHPTAVIHETAVIGKDVTVSPHAVIDKQAKIGAHTFIGPNCFVGPYTTIGEHCMLHPNSIIRERCQLGNRVILQPGAVIGSCGFGFTTDHSGRHTKLNQVGIVIIEDDVEIGANTTVDRSRFQETRICRGSKIDNLVQIGHGVTVGEDNLIVAQTGIAGSTTLGKNVVLAGQVAVAGHIALADGVIVSARSGVSKSLTKPGKYGGVPAFPLADFNRYSVQLRQIGTHIKWIKDLQSRIRSLEQKVK